jgi:hypothetical protein
MYIRIAWSNKIWINPEIIMNGNHRLWINLENTDPKHVKKCQGEKNEANCSLGKMNCSSTLLLSGLRTMGICNVKVFLTLLSPHDLCTYTYIHDNVHQVL